MKFILGAWDKDTLATMPEKILTSVKVHFSLKYNLFHYDRKSLFDNNLENVLYKP